MQIKAQSIVLKTPVKTLTGDTDNVILVDWAELTEHGVQVKVREEEQEVFDFACCCVFFPWAEVVRLEGSDQRLEI